MLKKHIEHLHDRLFDEYTRVRSYTELAALTGVPIPTIRRMVRKGTGSIENWELVDKYFSKTEEH